MYHHSHMWLLNLWEVANTTEDPRAKHHFLSHSSELTVVATQADKVRVQLFNLTN